MRPHWKKTIVRLSIAGGVLQVRTANVNSDRVRVHADRQDLQTT